MSQTKLDLVKKNREYFFEVAIQRLSRFHFIEEMEVIDQPRQIGKKEWLISYPPSQSYEASPPTLPHSYKVRAEKAYQP